MTGNVHMTVSVNKGAKRDIGAIVKGVKKNNFSIERLKSLKKKGAYDSFRVRC